jgi:hypothetical protein
MTAVLMRKTTRGMIGILVVVVVMAHGKVMSQPRADPNQLKAAYLVQFVRYTKWPVDRLPEPDDVYVIGVLGDQELAKVLADEIRRTRLKINEREVSVKDLGKYVVDPEQEEREQYGLRTHVGELHALYLGNTDRRTMNGVLSVLSKKPVLTVSQYSQFVELGGMIELFLDEKVFRFNINKVSLDEARLNLDSKVLTLASRVVREEKESE